MARAQIRITSSKVKIRLGLVVAALGITVVAVAGPAFAHSDVEGTDPEAGSELESVPPTVSVTFSETPADADRFKVQDGCGRNVIETASVEDKTIEATIADAQPGTWLVEWHVVSAEDGHPSDGSIAFTVGGKSDCSAELKNDEEKHRTATDEGTDDGGSASIFVWLGLGTIALVAIALLVRTRSAGS